MPWYRVGPYMVHMKLVGKAKNTPRCGARHPWSNNGILQNFCCAMAPFLCDWKMDGTTCDTPICTDHAQEVAPDKHLCPVHQAAYAEWIKTHPGPKS